MSAPVIDLGTSQKVRVVKIQANMISNSLFNKKKYFEFIKAIQKKATISLKIIHLSGYINGKLFFFFLIRFFCA